MHGQEHSKKPLPTRLDALAFGVKAGLFRLDRARRNLFDGDAVRFTAGFALAEAPVVAESKTKLWTEANDAERPLLVGKIHNLRLALRGIDGVEIPAGRIFSFWAHVGRPTRLRGFVAGRELREGCVIPSVGGGLCQLSNALYDAALKAGFEIVERHAHTNSGVGSLGGGPLASGERIASDPFAKVSDNMNNILYHDDSNVGLEQQVAAITKNHMQHNLALTILNSQFRLLQTAVSERA